MGPTFSGVLGRMGPLGAGLEALTSGGNPFMATLGASKTGKALGVGASSGENSQDGKTKFASTIKKFFPEVGDNIVVSGADGEAPTVDPWQGMRDVGGQPQTGLSSPTNTNPFAAVVPQPTTQDVVQQQLDLSAKNGYVDGQPVGVPKAQVPVVATQGPAQPADPNDMAPYRAAIASIEAPGYGTIGPTHPKYGRALGQYQVMESNLPQWSQKALGRVVSAEEFLATPAIQDAIFDDQFRDSIKRYGTPQDAASVWFTGRPTTNKSAATAKDSLGTSGADYVAKFNNALRSNKRMAPPGVGQIQRPGLDAPQVDLGGGPQLAPLPVAPKDPVQAIFDAASTRRQAKAPEPVADPLAAQQQPAPTPQGPTEAEQQMDRILDQIEKTRNMAQLKQMDRRSQLAMFIREGARVQTNASKAGINRK